MPTKLSTLLLAIAAALCLSACGDDTAPEVTERFAVDPLFANQIRWSVAGEPSEANPLQVGVIIHLDPAGKLDARAYANAAAVWSLHPMVNMRLVEIDGSGAEYVAGGICDWAQWPPLKVSTGYVDVCWRGDGVDGMPGAGETGISSTRHVAISGKIQAAVLYQGSTRFRHACH